MGKEHGFRERCGGMALISAVGICLPLIIAAGTMLASLVSNLREVELRQGQITARAVADAGVHDALAVLSQDPGFQGEYALDRTQGTARIQVLDWAADGQDNDGDAVADEADEQDIVAVLSRGFVNAEFDQNGNVTQRSVRSYGSAVEVLLRRIQVNLQFEQAVYIDDPLASLDISGNAFLLDGRDHDLDGNLTGNPDRPAIGTPGDPQDLIDQLGGNQEDNIIGLGGEPSIATVPEVDMSDYIAALEPLATVHFAPGATFGGTVGASGAPVIAHAQGDLDLHGGTEGHGILLVDGDLTVTGNFAWVGVVVVSGSVSFKGGGGTKNLYGALLSLGSVDAEVEITGSVELHYSSAAVDSAAQVASGYSVVAWIQR